MSEMAPLLLRLVGSSVSAATRAGAIIREVLQKGDLGIVDKGKNDLQTEADRSAQRCIVTSLTERYPDITIIGEETLSSVQVPKEWIANQPEESILTKSCPNDYQNLTEQDIVVWVDPLDGTAEYTQGLLDHVTVLIGIAVKDKAVGGVIHQPFFKQSNNELGRTIWGINGVGVGGFEPQTPPQGKLILTTTRSHSNAVVEEALKSLNPDEVLRVGGAGYKVLLLLEGKAHAYVFASRGCKRWDTCAPEAVLTSLGGKLTDVYGNVYPYDKNTQVQNSNGVVATVSSEYHSRCLKAIPKNCL